jgi:hypothetical protein
MDKPLPLRYGHWLKSVGRGDLGYSYLWRSSNSSSSDPRAEYLVLGRHGDGSLDLVIGAPSFLGLGVVKPMYDNMWADDAKLVDHCLRGDDAAWAVLLSKYKNLIFSIPIEYGFSREEAAHIFQSVCLDVICELKRLRAG